ncbi:MAG: hypothetical protein HZA52_00370 [Planctomycetes bacterium]|nr:hypothetical protein [Planctomycetota bacterium]
MNSLVALLVAFVPQAASIGAERHHAVDVVAAGGQFSARVRKAEGQEQVDDVLARWLLTVEMLDHDGTRTALWSNLVRHRPGERSHFVADDGFSFVEVDPSCETERELVRIWRVDGEERALDASQLGLDRCTGPWLANAAIEWIETPVGPAPQLLLWLAAGGLRRVDLASGLVASTREWASEVTAGPLVDPEFIAAAQASYVKSASAPERVHWGEPLELVVQGAHPTPNQQFAGFSVELGGTFRDAATGGDATTGGDAVAGGERTSVLVTPLSLPPPNDRPQAQVLVDFRHTATIVGLAPGRYSVRVIGRGDRPIEPLAVEITHARPWVELGFQGGRTVRLHATGVVVDAGGLRGVAPRIRVLDADERARLESAFRGLPKRSSGATASSEYRLSWTVDGKHLDARFGGGSLDAALLAFVQVLGGANSERK